MRPLPKLLTPLLLSALLPAAPAVAQYGDYLEPGALGKERRKFSDEVKKQQQDPRWQLGPIELVPHLSIGNLSYVSNVYSTAENEAESDLRASAVGGLRAFLNLGPKVLVSPFASLDYSWWQEQTDLRSLNESVGVQLFGDLNRVQIELQTGRVERQRNLSSELEVPVDLRDDRAQLAVEVDFWGPFSLFATAGRRESRHFGAAAERQRPELALSSLDVDTESASGGLGYRFGTGLELRLGYERAQADFLDDPGGRSNQSSGLLLGVALKGPRLSIDADATRREIEFAGRRGGGARRQVTGAAQVGWKLTEKLSSRVYGSLRLQPSAVAGDAVFEGSRTGLSLNHQTARRLLVGAFYERGEDEFARVSDDRFIRVDDVTSYGLSLRLKVTDRLSVEVAAVDSRRESTDPAFDRSLTAVTSRIGLGGNLLPW